MVTSSRARIIDGKALAAEVKADIRRRVERLRAAGGAARLDAVLAEGNASADIYARNQASTCKDLGIEYVLHRVPGDAAHDDLADRIEALNADPQVTAIMVHLPMPFGVEPERLQSLIAVEKDVEGVNPANIGNIVYGRRSLVPCTALAVMEMIETTGVALPGTRCVCVGASNIVGKPVAVLLMRAEATVISTNVHTREPGVELTRDGRTSSSPRPACRGSSRRTWSSPARS